MNIRRVSPIPWNTGTACPPITIPHMSRSPCHGKREQQIQMRFVNVIAFGNATEPEKNNRHHKYRSQTEIPGRTRGVQENDWVVQTLEFRFGKILEIVGIVVWEQVSEGWH